MIDGIYQVQSILGQGGSSRVLRCTDTNETHYALKVIKNEKNFSWEKVEKMLSKEYYISELLNSHPNILKCLTSVTNGTLDSGAALQNVKYNVLEVAQNGSLSRFIRGTGPIEENIAKFIFIQLASAVKHMHDSNIAHFDIKLENILLDEFYNIKLADFGSAEIMENIKSLFKYKKGTNWYMAPEVANWVFTKEAYSPFKADIYSLGVWLFLLLLGEFPVHTQESSSATSVSGDEMDVDDKIGNCWNVQLQSPRNTELSSECKDLLSLMIRNNPYERSSIDEVLAHPWLNQESLESDIHARIYEEFEARKLFILSNAPKCN